MKRKCPKCGAFMVDLRADEGLPGEWWSCSKCGEEY